MSTTTRSPAVKRIMSELRELSADSSPEYSAHPLDDNLFEWHFSIRGPQGTAFEGGIYHGRIILPAEYPFKPPSIIFLTPNGRFRTNEKICLSVTGFHPEFWRPAWGIRTVLLAMLSFMPTHAEGAIGGLETPDEERRKMAKLSVSWTCPYCKTPNSASLPALPPDATSGKGGTETASGTSTSDDAKELISLLNFRYGEPKKDGKDKDKDAADQPTKPPADITATPATTGATPQSISDSKGDDTPVRTAEEKGKAKDTTESTAAASSSSVPNPATSPPPQPQPQSQPLPSRPRPPIPPASSSRQIAPVTPMPPARTRAPSRETELMVLDAIIAVVVAAIAMLLARKVGVWVG